MTCCRPRKDKPIEDHSNETMNCSAVAIADTHVPLGTATCRIALSPRERQSNGDSSAGEIVITPARIPQFRSFACPERSSSSSISLHEGAQSFRPDSCDSCKYTSHRRRKRKHRKDEENHGCANMESVVQLCRSTFEAIKNQSPGVLLEDRRTIDAAAGDGKPRCIPRKLLDDPLTPISSSRQST